MEQGHDFGGAEKRRIKRSRVLLRARITADGRTLDVRLRNLSQLGALLQCVDPPVVDTVVIFERGDTNARARVVWSTNGSFGIEFDTPIDEHEVLMHVTVPPPLPLEPAPEPDHASHRRDVLTHTLTPEERRFGEDWFNSPGHGIGD
jgi:hypothetical protein